SGSLDGSTMSIRKGGPEGELLASFPINKSGQIIRPIPFKKIEGNIDLYLEIKNPNSKPDQTAARFIWFAFVPKLKGEDKSGYAAVQKSWEEILNFQGTKLPILIENPDFMARETRVFERGNWMVLGDKVQPETPKELNPWKAEWPANRLG